MRLEQLNPNGGSGSGHARTMPHGESDGDASSSRRHHSSDDDADRYTRHPVQPLRQRGTPQKRSVESRCLRGQLPMRRGEMTMFCHANAPLFSDFFLMG
jgi:hypothetical protein